MDNAAKGRLEAGGNGGCDDDDELTEQTMLDMHAKAFASMGSAVTAAKDPQQQKESDIERLRQLERDFQGAKRLGTANTKSMMTFSSFVSAGLLAANTVTAAGQSGSAIDAGLEVFKTVYLPCVGRRSTLTRGSAADAGTTVPAAVHADDVAEGPKNVPRPSPIAAPEGVVNSQPDRLDMRALASTGWSLYAATYHTRRALQMQQQHGSRHAGLYGPAVGGPLDPVECSMEHVAWCLTEAHGPFKPCSFSACQGTLMIGVSDANLVRLKQYVSPWTREQYERTGNMPRNDEHGRPHIELCIIDYLNVLSATASGMLITGQAAPMFPTFYNPTGRKGTYAPSALTGFSVLHAGGLVRAYRNFLPDQLVPSKSIKVTETKELPSGAVESRAVYLRGYVERRDIVEWRPEVEYNPAKLIYLHEAPPPDPPSVRPPHAPQAADATPITPGLVTRPPEVIDAGATLRAARAAVVHMLPRQPVATTITYNRVAPAVPKPPAEPAAAPPKQATPKPSTAQRKGRKPSTDPSSTAARTAAGSGRKTKRAKTAGEPQGAAVAVKAEPRDEDDARATRISIKREPGHDAGSSNNNTPTTAFDSVMSFMHKLHDVPSVATPLSKNW